MKHSADRLFDLLPLVYRQRDAAHGWPLRALLEVIGEQVTVVEQDIERLYANWFIETCDDWVVPYIGDLIGHRLVAEAGPAASGCECDERQLDRVLISRREVAKVIQHRRRKGTLSVLEQLAADVAGWPAYAIESQRRLSRAPHLNFLNQGRDRSVDVRDAAALELLRTPFGEHAHAPDVRRLRSTLTRGQHSAAGVGVFVWRLRAFESRNMPAHCAEDFGPHCFTFNVLSNDTPLFTCPPDHTAPAPRRGPLDVPAPIRRRAMARRLGDYYGEGKSVLIRRRDGQEIPLEEIVVADLRNWQYRVRPGKVAIDPERGRIAFPPRQAPRDGISVSYCHGFSAEMGGGSYHRPLLELAKPTRYRVGREPGDSETIGQVLDRWRRDQPQHAVIEVADERVFVEPIAIELGAGQALELRAADRVRPVLRLLDYQTDRPDAMSISGEENSRFTLDGFLVTGRGIRLGGDLARFTMRHSTLVPGWGLRHDCEPRRPSEPSLEIETPNVCVVIEHSILGAIQVNLDEVTGDPVRLCLSDSILDATSDEREALGAPGHPLAHAIVTLRRTTVLGRILTHAIQLAENSILGDVHVARSQIGCARFSWIEPQSRTPATYKCQPIKDASEPEIARMRPRFNSVRYGTPDYCQLAEDCAEEIRRGADDESEMGAFHHLYQPQREANLIARLDEYTPAGVEAAIIHAT